MIELQPLDSSFEASLHVLWCFQRVIRRHSLCIFTAATAALRACCCPACCRQRGLQTLICAPCSGTSVNPGP